MAQTAPKAFETENIQFKLNATKTVFQRNSPLRNHVDLLAVSNNYGLAFIGDPNTAQLKVLPIIGYLNSKIDDGKILARTISLPNTANCLATSSDGSLIAVNYTINSGSFLTIYNVPSCYTANIQIHFTNIILTTDNNVSAKQILWNPVINNTLAVVLSDGSFIMFNLKDNNYEIFSLDKREQAKCACWSPKGKQIVVGFPNGKLSQFKPDLKLARSIVCPGNIHDGPFDTIAVQWMSTYQFAASFLQHGEDMQPCLYIINAPKAGSPIYINYYDICFSGSGPRTGQIFLIHIQAWNLLLVASANSMEIALIGTNETGDLPNWHEYTLNDVRLTLPMSRDKEETYPIGIALFTGCVHQLTINETQLPVMPMVHLLSTDGQLVAFDFLNLMPQIPGICSPANISTEGLQYYQNVQIEENQTELVENIQSQPFLQSDNVCVVTSTPAPKSDTSQPLFLRGTTTMDKIASNASSVNQTQDRGNTNMNSTLFHGLGQLSTDPSNSLMSGAQQQQKQPEKNELFKSTGLSFFGNKENTRPSIPTTKTTLFSSFQSEQETVQTQSGNFAVKTISESVNNSKPLYTVPPTYQQSVHKSASAPQIGKDPENKSNNFTDEITTNIIQEMINTEINCFQLELNELAKKSKNMDISIGNIDETKNCTKRLNDLEEIKQDAKENCFEIDVQMLRYSVNECFGMISELESKLEMFKNPDLSIPLKSITEINQSSNRQLAKLNSNIVINQMQLKLLEQQLNEIWSTYQDITVQYTNSKMHIPNLEKIYRTLATQKNILRRERKKLNYFKSKLTIRDFIDRKDLTGPIDHMNMNSLADSFLTISLSESVKTDKSRLNIERMEAIRNTLKNHKLICIKPKRPERMKSECIMECKIKTAKTKVMQMNKNISKPEIKKTEATPAPAISSASKQFTFKSNTGVTFQPQDTNFNFNNIGSSTFSDAFLPNSKDSNLENKTKEVSGPQSTVTPSLFSFKNDGFAGNTGGSTLFGKKEKTVGIFGTGGLQTSPIVSEIPIPLMASNLTTTKVPITFSTDPNQSNDGSKNMFKLSTDSTVLSNSPSNDKKTLMNSFSSRESVVHSENNLTPNTTSLISPITKTVDSTDNLFSGKNIEFGKKALSFGQSAAVSTTSAPFSGFSGINSSNATTTSMFSGLTFGPSKKENSTLTLGDQGNIQNGSSLVFGKSLTFAESPPKNESSSNIFGGFRETGNTTKTSTVGSTGSISTSGSDNNKNIFSGIEITSTAQGLTNTSATSNATSPFSGFTSLNSSFLEPTQLSFSGFGAALPAAESQTGQSSSKTTTVSPTVASQENSTTTTQSQNSSSIFTTLNLKSKEPQVQQSSPQNLALAPANTSTPNTTITNVFSSNTYTSSAFNSGVPVTVSQPAFMFSKSSETDNQNNNKSQPVNTTVTSTISNSISAFGIPSQTPSIFSTNIAPTSNTMTAATSIQSFGNLGSPVSSTTSFLPSVPATTTSPFAPAPPISSTALLNFANASIETRPNIFSSTVTTSQGSSIFSGIAKPEQNVFGSPVSSFGSQVANGTPPAFASPNANIFSSGISNQPMNPFGTMSSSSSIFGGMKNESANIFDVNSNQQVNGGSIFGSQSIGFPASGDQSQSTSIFGDSSAGNSVGFNSGSIFGGSNLNAAQNTQFGGSTIENTGFGTGLFSGAAASSSPFGNTQQNTSNPFAQSPGSVAQTGFGSLNSSFSKPTVFGGAPTFSSPPTFGGAPAFGGPATFGSFGGTQTAAGAINTPFSSPQQKNSLFEELGSSGDAVSFGNLAQTANQGGTKPSFVAGTSFSNWR